MAVFNIRYLDKERKKYAQVRNRVHAIFSCSQSQRHYTRDRKYV